MEPNYVTSDDGTKIAWYDFGGSGPDVLLGHATGFCGQIWSPIIKHLRPYLRCVAHDARGHGLSGSPGSPSRSGFDWNRLADDALAVMEAAELTHPFGIGHSSGGATQLLIEERKSTFRSLYVFEPVIFADNPPIGPMPERGLAVRARKRRRSFASRNEAFNNFAQRGPFADFDPEVLQAYVDHGFSEADDEVVLRCNPDNEAEIYVMATDHNGYVDLPEVACPVVVARGSHSQAFSTENMQAVIDRLPPGLGRLEIFEDLGHFGPLEAPKTFAYAVLAAFGIYVSPVD